MQNLKLLSDHKVPEELKYKNNYAKEKEMFLQALLELNESKKNEINNLTTQYEHWLQKKDAEFRTAVLGFNQYRERKTFQLRKGEQEIIKLVAYIDKLEDVVKKAEMGKFFHQQKITTAATVSAPFVTNVTMTEGLVFTKPAGNHNSSNNNGHNNTQQPNSLVAGLLAPGIKLLLSFCLSHCSISCDNMFLQTCILLER